MSGPSIGTKAKRGRPVGTKNKAGSRAGRPSLASKLSQLYKEKEKKKDNLDESQKNGKTLFHIRIF